MSPDDRKHLEIIKEHHKLATLADAARFAFSQTCKAIPRRGRPPKPKPPQPPA